MGWLVRGSRFLLGTRERGRPPGRTDAPDAAAPAMVLQGAASPANHGILAAVRSLGRFGVPVFALLYRPSPTVQRSKYLRGARTVDLTCTTATSLAELTQGMIGSDVAPVLIPVDDVAMSVVAGMAPLSDSFLAPKQPLGGLRQLADKWQLTALARQLGIPVPDARVVSSRSELLAAAAEIGYPVVLKGADPVVTLRASVGAESVRIMRSAGELTRAYDRMDDRARANTLLQEYIPTRAASDWIFDGYFDHASECLFSGTGLKVRQWPLGTGAATLGMSLPNPVIEDLSLRLATAVQYSGMIDIDYRYDERDDQYKLLDVNARMGASFRLFVSDDGLDTARVCYLDLTGQPVPRTHARAGRKWIVEQRDLQSCIHLLRTGRLTVRDLARSLTGVDELAWFDRDDAAPFGALLQHYVPRLLRPRSRGIT